MDADGSALTSDDLTAIRRQLTEGQSLIRDTVDRLRQSQEENEMISRRRDELESRVATLETEYEELLGETNEALCLISLYSSGAIEKTIHDEETSDVDVAESMTDFKACFCQLDPFVCLTNLTVEQT